MRRLSYRIVLLIICFSTVYTVEAALKKAEKVETCFPDLTKEYKKLKKTIRKIEKNTQDNYLYVLPVYNLNYPIDTSSDTWKTLASIIQKTTAEIDSAATKDSAYCPAIAEIYKMKGIALFYQKQYQPAYKVFETLVTNFASGDLLIESSIWLTRATIYLHAYDETEFFLAETEKLIDTNQNDLFVFFHTIAAEYYIRINDYQNALEHLTKSINRGSALNTRLSFITAQIAEQLKSYPLALLHYNNVYQDYNKLFQRIFTNNMMKSYAFVYRHLCEKIIEKQYFDSIAEAQWNKTQSLPLPTPQNFEPTIVESSHDSSFLGKSYPYYFNDYAAMFFLNEYFDDFLNEDDYDDSEYFDGEYEGEGEDDGSDISEEMLESIFENWESIAIHIPKTDFGNMQDTIYLPLITTASAYKLPHLGAVVSRFGWRRYRYHYGIDLKGSTGDSIFCLFDGVVRIAVRNKTYGNVVIVRHYNGLETFYAHCSKLLVDPNQEVKAGELLGLVGNTGRSKGPHLHLETRYKGSAFNPEYMIDFENKKLISDTLMLTKETFNYKNTYSSSTSSSSSSSSSSTAKYHKVKSGESLSSIARKYKTSVSNLKKMNGLKSDMIKAGQRLRVP